MATLPGWQTRSRDCEYSRLSDLWVGEGDKAKRDSRKSSEPLHNKLGFLECHGNDYFNLQGVHDPSKNLVEFYHLEFLVSSGKHLKVLIWYPLSIWYFLSTF